MDKLDYLDYVYSYVKDFIPYNSDVAFFIACQSALESNFGTSDIAKKNHNLFGMKMPISRYTLAIKDVSNFAYYAVEVDSILDYLVWLFWNKPSSSNLSSVGSFASFLNDKGYCPEKDYIDKIISIYSQFKFKHYEQRG